MAIKKQSKKAPDQQEAPTGNAVTALILGILSLIIPGVGFILAIIAIILGITVLKHKESKGFGIAGIIMGGISIILHIIITILIVVFVSTMIDGPSAAMSMIPGAEGCQTDGTITCEAYEYNDVGLTLTLAGAGEQINSIEAQILGSDIENENKCMWTGLVIVGPQGATITLPCDEPIQADNAAIFEMEYDKNGMQRQSSGFIVP